MSQIIKESIKKEDNEEKLKIDLSENELIIKYIEDIKKDRNRINAIKHLSKYSEKNSLLSIYLWYSTGVIAAILQEIINYYQYFSLLKLTQEKSNELCAAISLFKCVASNVETRDKFIDSQLPIFLYPFLSNTSKSKPYEYVKLTTLSLFGALVNDNNSKIISYLTGKEIIPLCLRIIERGTELSKFTASFILLRITNNESGFNYICENKNRFYIIIRVLSIALKGKLSSRIVKFFFKIFARLSENKKIRTILKTVLQEEIKGQNYYENLDDSSKDSFNILKKNLEDNTSEMDINIEKLKKDLTNKNEGIKNNFTMNNKNMIAGNNNRHQTNINGYNPNNLNVNLMYINQMNHMMQQKYNLSQVGGEINNYNLNDNYMNQSIYNQSVNNGYNINFQNP